MKTMFFGLMPDSKLPVRVDAPVFTGASIFRIVRALQVLLLGLAAFAILTVRFSPNWAAVYFGINEINVDESSPINSAAIGKAFLSGYSARGSYVLKQASDLGAEIDEANHKIVRWRLLVPALGHYLNLPGSLIMGLAHLGCAVLIMMLVGLSWGQSARSGRAGFEALCFSLAAGASAPFFTSMGWLGYYDSWLAVGLLAVAYARNRWAVLIACLLAPWIDERFVIGLPLALCVRWIRSTGSGESPWQWLKAQAMAPLILAALYAVVRFQLGGSGGSQTVTDYIKQFILSQELTFANYIVGAWAGLRVGWFLAGAAIAASWRVAASVQARLQALLLSLGVPLTALLGLFTALDLSRSMVLLYPALPLGWAYAARTQWWKRFHVAPLLALGALVLPAHHVIGGLAKPVDSLWSPPTPLADTYNTLGVICLNREGVARSEALKWFRKAVDQNYAGAQYNLGVMYTQDAGIPKDYAEAVHWFRKAAAQGLPVAQYNLGAMYFQGAGVDQDHTEAVKWFRKAAKQGIAPAQCNLAVLYFHGMGVIKDSTEAVKWFWKAALQGYVQAQSNLGGMYFNGDGVEKDPVRAKVWWQAAAEKGDEIARENLLLLEKQLNAEQEAQAAELARKLFRKPAKGR